MSRVSPERRGGQARKWRLVRADAGPAPSHESSGERDGLSRRPKGAPERPTERWRLIWSRGFALLSLLLAAFATGCGGSSDPKSKSTSGAPVSSGAQTMRLDSPDTDDPEFTYLKTQIEKRSHGALRVSIGADYSGADPANEVALVRAMRSGKRDFALVAARSWPAGGVPAFAALQAPFVIGTYDAARAALAGAAGASLMGVLKRAGVMPLALVPTELRRVLATRALTTPGNFHGARSASTTTRSPRTCCAGSARGPVRA